jgi:hypothetical protein
MKVDKNEWSLAEEYLSKQEAGSWLYNHDPETEA